MITKYEERKEELKSPSREVVLENLVMRRNIVTFSHSSLSGSCRKNKLFDTRTHAHTNDQSNIETNKVKERKLMKELMMKYKRNPVHFLTFATLFSFSLLLRNVLDMEKGNKIKTSYSQLY